MTDAPEIVTLEEALVIAREVAESLGGRQARALVVLCRHAERGRRSSSAAIRAVGSAADGVQHFLDARRELEKGREAISESIEAAEDALGRGLDSIRTTTRTMADAADVGPAPADDDG